MQNWKDLYTELCALISAKVPAVKWIDLWHNQVNFLEDEHPFPSPAVFLSFRANEVNDTGERVQHVELQVTVYVFFETFADSYNGSWNQSSALGFLDILNDVYAALHGSGGANYSEMRRIPGMSPVDTGGSGNLYQIPFSCNLIDYAAQKTWEDVEVDNVVITLGTKPEEEPEEPLYDVS